MTDTTESADVNSTTAPLPTWRKVIAFPLVSLVIALAASVGLIGVLSVLLENPPPAIYEPFGETGWMAFSAFAAIASLFILAKVLLRHLGEMPRDDLPINGAAKDTVLGFLGGGWLITMCVGVAFVLGVYSIEGWGTSSSAAMIILQGGLFAGFVEEVISRGIIFRFIEEFGGSWVALAISALVFGFLHSSNDNASVFSSFAIAVEGGILLGAAYMYTRNLWLAIGLHAGWNVVQGYIWDVPVSGNQVDGLVDSRAGGPELLSGGAFGLEASVIALVIATTAGLWLLREAARRGHVVQPRWTRRALARRAEI